MIAQSVAEVLSDHVRLTVEGIDRMYLNVYVPRLQSPDGGKFLPGASRAAAGLIGADEPDEPPVCRGFGSFHRAARASAGVVLQRPAQGRCDGRAAAQLRG